MKLRDGRRKKKEKDEVKSDKFENVKLNGA